MRSITLFILLAATLWCNASCASDFPVYELMVRITPETHALEGRAKITLPEHAKVHIGAEKLIFKKLHVDGKEYGTSHKESLEEIAIGAGKKTIEIEYSARFEAALPKESIRNEGVIDANAIDASGVMLLSGWYPELSMRCRYQLTVEIPKDFEAISESDSVMVSHDGPYKRVQFSFPHPTPGITLVAGKYHVTEEQYKGTTLRTYFFTDNVALANEYLGHTKEYLKLYESLVGPFPYKHFSVVENTFQTGFSFPSFTLLGSKVLRLPFIVKTSLGHEILHQWFGNYVYVDYEKGNWAEGLTTYLADHWYEHRKGKGSDYRKRVLIDYENYVTPESEVSLQAFRRRYDFSSRTVGYGKAAMVFHMLRTMVKDEVFFESLRKLVSEYKYRDASWDEIRSVFGSTYGDAKAINQFLDQWLQTKGIPSLKVTHAPVVFRDGHYTFALDIAQDREPTFKVNLSAKVTTADSEKKIAIRIDKEDVHYERKFLDRPLKVVIDGDYDIMRRLSDKEFPPVISGFTGRKESIVFLPEKDKKEYSDVADFFAQQGYAVKEHVTNDDLKEHSVLLLSPKNRLYRRLFAGRPLPEGGCVVKAHRNPFNPQRVIIVFQATNKEALTVASKKIFRYGNYSFLQFKNGKNTAKNIAKTDKGIILNLRLPVEAVATNRSMGLDKVVQKVRKRRVIFVGETHDNYAHHLVQREIIEELYGENAQLMIGMEMFQRPFQKYIDQYLSGDIIEKEMLKKTEYFKRWVFDYNLYRDILQFAHARKIPIIALNLRREIIDKVSEQGIDSLPEEMYAEIPHNLDMTNRDYKQSMREVFSVHSNNQERDFENFLQSQILWDETMAHAIAAAMEQYPDRQIVVLAGNGHLQYSWGIPDRVKRLTHERGAVILNGVGDTISRALADFVLFPDHSAAPETPKLQVLIEANDKGIVVKEVMKGGAAEKGGVKAGDLIKMVDHNNVEDIADLKIFLMDKKKGDTIKVRVYRTRPILRAEELVLNVTL